MTAQRFRKKPVEIEAMQWDGTAAGATPIIDWVLDGNGTARYDGPDAGDPDCPSIGGHKVFHYRPSCSYNDQDPHITIATPEGVMRAAPGDFVIRGVQGEFYSCKPDIFEQTYEPA